MVTLTLYDNSIHHFSSFIDAAEFANSHGALMSVRVDFSSELSDFLDVLHQFDIRAHTYTFIAEIGR